MLVHRRDVIKAAAALAVSTLPASLTLAASPSPAKALGLQSLSDGHLSFPLTFYLPDAPPEERTSLLQANGYDAETVTPDCNVTLFRNGDRLILFDTGSGSRFMDSAGLLPQSLETLGIDPEDVTDVVFTHAHPDHLWGVLDDFDEPLFSNATHHISKIEWDFWTDENTMDKMPETQKSFAAGAKRNLEAIEEGIVRFEFGTEILPDVFALDTSGHTPGHASFEIQQRGDRFLVIGDAITHPVVSFQRPDWTLGTDQDGEKAIRTRKMLLDRLASEKIGFLGYHLTAPGIGYAERHAGAYRFVPA